MLRYNYVKAVSLEDAYVFLSEQMGKARILAGGTDLIVAIRDKDASVKGMEYVLDISGLKTISGIREKDGIITIGALTTHEEVKDSELIGKAAPLLARACSMVGGPQTRMRGTLGGNLCNASSCADAVTALTALDAVLTISSLKGNRQVPIETFLPGYKKTVLQEDEILTEISFAVLNERETSAYIKLGRRKAMAVARMNVGAVIEQTDGMITNARISVGAAFPAQRRVRGVEAQLIGKKPDEKMIEEACQEAAKEMLEITGVRWSTEYKEPVIQTLIKRCVVKALMVE